MVAPFALLNYADALAAWALSMTFLYVATVRLLGVRLSYSIAIGLGIAVTFPGGVRHRKPGPGHWIRDSHRLPVPLPPGARRPRTRIYLAAAILPVLWQTDIWRQYLIHGTNAITANANRGDNASILGLTRAHLGLHDIVTLTILVVIAIGIGFAQHDLFWPAVWLLVATLPIAWMYSLLTLLPLLIFALRMAPRRTTPLVIITSAVIIGSPPFGAWPTEVFPVLITASAVICALARPVEPTLWFGPWTRHVRRSTTPERVTEESHVLQAGEVPSQGSALPLS